MSIDRPLPQLRNRLALLMFLVAILPLALGAAAWYAREAQRSAHARAQQLSRLSETVALSLDQHLALHQKALLSLAADLAEFCRTPDCQQRHLDRMRRTYPVFLTALIADAAGTIQTISAPPRFEENLRRVLDERQSVADREYFRVPREQLQPFVSDVFRGRGLGEQPVVAMSAPLIVDGGFAGIVQTAVQLEEFRLFDRLLDQDPVVQLAVEVVDRQGRVVYARGGGVQPVLSDFPLPREALVPGDSGEFAGADGRRLYGVAKLPTWDWLVVVHISRAEQQEPLQRALLGLLLGGLLIAALVSLLARWMAGQLSRPLEQLAQGLGDLEISRSLAPIAVPQRTFHFVEFQRIVDEVHRLSGRVNEAYRVQSLALIAQDQANSMLADTVAERDRYIQRQTEDLRQALLMAEQGIRARDELLANTSHEIRTPLNGIIGTCELLKRARLSHEEKSQVETILRCAEGLLLLINDILDLTRASTGHISIDEAAFSVGAEVESVLDALRPLAQQRGLKLYSTVSPELSPQHRGDALRLRQVLLNLVGNALKFTEQGGVEVRVLPMPGGGVRIEVHDTGVGIAVDDLKRIFEPFVQVDSSSRRRFQGTGLGLAISRRVVELMGGTINAESTPGRGSRFIVELPLKMALAAFELDSQESVGPAKPRPRRVLVVDDVEVNRDVLVQQLAALDCEALAVDGGQAALEALANADFDLVLLDCQMPGMDGYEVVRRIRRELGLSSLPVVAVTAHAGPDERERCLIAGMDRMVTKPLRIATLEKLLEEIGSAHISLDSSRGTL
jgi:signal transduction histidine kinase